ncbi:MAG TPA: hypothetical protein VFM82_12205 [Flavobacteriaceae bacterium]|nr:hypothetical protein [Flavobacteriaceae bacterium]
MSDIKECLKNLIGWKNHYDQNEVPELEPELNESESGEFYQQFHPAMRLDLISASLPENRDLNEYLSERVETGIVQLYNQILIEKKLDSYRKELLANGKVITGSGFSGDTIINESRFVGIRLELNSEIGITVAINSLAFQITQAQTDLPIYIYHSSKVDPVKVLTFSSQKGGQWAHQVVSEELNNLDNGYWIIGYYQDDLTGQAIQYKRLNWHSGFCQSCNGGIDSNRYKAITKYVRMMPIYVPNASLDPNRKMFDMADAFEVPDNNFGINLNLSAKCDLKDFVCQNKSLLTNALGLKVTHLILRDIKFSQQINHIEESLKNLIIRDLEGDTDTHYVNIVTQLSRAVKSVNIDFDNLSKICLPCTKKNQVKYGVV